MRHLLPLCLFLSLPLRAGAVTAQDLYHLKMPDACGVEFANLGTVIKDRDRNIPLERWLQANQTLAPAQRIAEDKLRAIYEYSDLSEHALLFYFVNACHAGAYALPVETLAQARASLAACFSQPAGSDCGRRVLNEILGLPLDYAPPPPMAIAPPRTMRPPMDVRPSTIRPADAPKPADAH